MQAWLRETKAGGVIAICAMAEVGTQFSASWQNANIDDAALPDADLDYLITIQNTEARNRSELARKMARSACAKLGFIYQGTLKSDGPRPKLVDSDVWLSLSHTRGWAAAYVHPYKPCGLDLELISEKALRVAPRFLSSKDDPAAFLTKESASLAFCMKEAVYKCAGISGLSVRDGIELMDINRGTVKCHDQVFSLDWENLGGIWAAWISK